MAAGIGAGRDAALRGKGRLGRFARSPVAMPVTFAVIAIALLSASKVPEAMRHDFLNLYSGASLAREGRAVELYDAERLFQREKALMPDIADVAVFGRPPWYAAILAPISLLPYRAWTFAAWVAVQTGLLGICWAWAVRRFGVKVIDYTCLYLAPIAGIAYGQDCVVPLAVVIAAYVLATKQRDFVGGLVLGLGLFQFQLFLMWPPLLVRAGKWRMLGGIAVAAGLEIAASVWVSGMSGLRTYALFVLHPNEALNPAPEKMVSLWGAMANLGVHSPAPATALAAGLALTIMLALRQKGNDQLFVRAIVGSLFIAPHVYMYHATILLLPIWLLIFRSGDAVAAKAARWFAKPYAFFALLLAPVAPLPIVGALATGCLFAASLRFRRDDGAQCVREGAQSLNHVAELLGR